MKAVAVATSNMCHRLLEGRSWRISTRRFELINWEGQKMGVQARHTKAKMDDPSSSGADGPNQVVPAQTLSPRMDFQHTVTDERIRARSNGDTLVAIEEVVISQMHRCVGVGALRYMIILLSILSLVGGGTFDGEVAQVSIGENVAHISPSLLAS
jgi:hypothetical protein